jgi:hypothetical protein
VLCHAMLFVSPVCDIVDWNADAVPDADADRVDADAVPCHAALAMRSLRLLFIWWVLMRRRGIRRRDDVIELRMDWRSYVEE